MESTKKRREELKLGGGYLRWIGLDGWMDGWMDGLDGLDA